MNNESPTIFGDGEQSRDFIFVKDVTKATIQAAESDATGIFNIGSGESTTINKLAKLCIDLLGKSVDPVYKDPRSDDIKDSLADITRAKTFGYSPEYDLKKGLDETIRSFTDRALPIEDNIM
jgi:UDP-glucose 4-epimerase